MSNYLIQQAPWPKELEDIVTKTTLWPGWHLWLDPDMIRDPKETHGVEGRGSSLIIQTKTWNTYDYDVGQEYRVRHIFIIPAATFNHRSWQRWLFDRFVDVQTHEAMEAFVVDGNRPYAPHHGPGENPYVVIEHGTKEETQTSFRGTLNTEKE